MKRLTYIAFFACWLCGCDDRYESLRNLNSAPSIGLQAQKGGEVTHQLADSVKLSKAPFAYIPFYIVISDPNSNIRAVNFQNLQGGGKLYFKDESVSNPVPVLDNKALFRFQPDGIGQNLVQFVVTDRFGLADSALLNLTVFNNLPPVASLYAQQIAKVDRYEFLFDASASFDQDKTFGGVITQYIYTVNAEKIQTVEPAIKYIFPAPGSYTVKLQVMDNDNTLSKEVTTQIQVN